MAQQRIVSALFVLLTALVGLCKFAFATVTAQSAAFLRRRQRLVYLSQVSSCNSLQSARRRRPRRFWVRPGRTQRWWRNFEEDCVLPVEWKENFRMRKETFLLLCSHLRPYLEQQETNMRKPLSVECQVTLTLYYLSCASSSDQENCSFFAIASLTQNHRLSYQLRSWSAKMRSC